MAKNNRIPKIRGSKRTSREVITNQKEFDKSCNYKVEWRYGTKWNQQKTAKYRYMACRECGSMTVASPAATAITCSSCVQKMVDPPVFKSSIEKTGRPAGWHFMKEYVDKDGNVFHKGVEKPELKGTLKPTVIEKKKRLTKREKAKIKQEANSKIYDLKKQLKKAKFKKDQRVINRQIKYYQRISAGRIPKNYLENNSE